MQVLGGNTLSVGIFVSYFFEKACIEKLYQQIE